MDPKRSQETPGAALKRQARQKVEKRGGKVDFGSPPGMPRGRKIHEKTHRKTIKKRYLPKTTFFHNLSAFPGFRRRFSSILDPKMDARTVIFQRFFGTVFSHRFFVIFVGKKKKREI